MPKSSKLKIEKKKILFLATEIKPFISLSPTAHWIHHLIDDVNQTQEYEIRVIMPKFGLINERRSSLHEVQRLSGINVSVNHEEISLVVKVGALKPSKIQVYFLDNEYLFDRKGFFHDQTGNFYEDNHNRVTFINKSVLEVLTYLRWNPQIIHAIGWPWSLLPMYAKTNYKSSVALKKAKYIYTHDGYAFEEKLNPKVLESTKGPKLEVPPKESLFFDLAATYCDEVNRLTHSTTEDPEEAQKERKAVSDHYKALYKKVLMPPQESATTSDQAPQSPKFASLS